MCYSIAFKRCPRQSFHTCQKMWMWLLRPSSPPFKKKQKKNPSNLVHLTQKSIKFWILVSELACSFLSMLSQLVSNIEWESSAPWQITSEFLFLFWRKKTKRFLGFRQKKSKRKLVKTTCVNEVDSGSGWLMRPVLCVSVLKKDSKNNASLHPFRFLLLVRHLWCTHNFFE